MRENELRLLQGFVPKGRTSFFMWFLCGLISLSCGKKKKETRLPETPESANTQKTEEKIPLRDRSAGKAIYERYCLVCHQADGSGVPGLNAPLIRSELAQGPEKSLLAILLYGSEAAASTNSGAYANTMPGFEQLSDKEIAEVASYVRNSFENTGSEVNPEKVAEIRSLPRSRD